MSSNGRRIARNRARLAEAPNPWRRYNAARDAVASAVEYADDPIQASRSWVGEVAEAARSPMARVDLPSAKTHTCEQMLSAEGRYQLSEAMTCLHMLIGYLDDDADRDRAYEQHATQLARIAAAIEEGT